MLADERRLARHLAAAIGAGRCQFAQFQKRDAQRIQRLRRDREQACRVAVVRALRLAIGRQAHRGPVGADRIDDGAGHFPQQPHAIVRAAAIVVAALVDAVAQEFVDQIAVRGMDLDAVEPGRDRVAGRLSIGVKQMRDFGNLQRARRWIILVALIGMRMARRSNRAGRHGIFARHGRMHQPAHMPQLRDDATAGLMHGVSDRLPPFDLLLTPQARRIGPAQPLPRNARRFADDEAGRGALAIIIDHQRRRHMIAGRAGAGQRRHQNAVGRGNRAKLDRIEQAGHSNNLLRHIGFILKPRWMRPATWGRLCPASTLGAVFSSNPG